MAGAGAVLAAVEQVQQRARAVAAALLEASLEDVVWEGERFFVRGAPGRAVTFAEVAEAAYRVPGVRSVSPGLEAVAYFDPPPATFSNGVHVAVVEVDPETGLVRILGYFVAEDCGRIINPLVVRGQLCGAVAQGIGEALLEHAAYDDQGQPLATTFMDYLIPTVWEVPDSLEVVHLERPSERPGGFKGMGEGGAIGAPAALANAVADAVGAPVTCLPLTPELVLELVKQGRAAGDVDRASRPA